MVVHLAYGPLFRHQPLREMPWAVLRKLMQMVWF